MTQEFKRQSQDDSVVSKKRHNSNFTKEDIISSFDPHIWDEAFRDNLKQQVSNNKPYRWGTITNLMDETLLRQVRKEIEKEIVFSEKETDIYKVHQSGDLANISGLNWDDLSRLPSLFKLRDAIYSETFRDYISGITGCGKLSGIKTDMSINTYTRGCHLLTHDDVIGSRRLSFILYLPDPDKIWKAHYGGALRLFGSVVPNVPKTDFECKLVPQFNQIAFFTVQPGLSFHDVEEVRVDKNRLSIQGWFHIPQEGEDGYIPGEQEKTEAKSTLQQLQTKELQEYDFPKPLRNEVSSEEIKLLESVKDAEYNKKLSEDDLNYLSVFLNKELLTEESISKLNETFINESVIEISDLLNEEYQSVLKDSINSTELNEKTPQTSSEIEFPWKCSVPPHKQRYMYIDGKSQEQHTEDFIKFRNHIGPQELPNFELLKLVSTKDKTTSQLLKLASFFKSFSFKKWLLCITNLIVTRDQILIRRFRPGQDFILATSIDTHHNVAISELDCLLEATVNLTPSANKAKNWEHGENGGYELCMSTDNGDDEEDDPAIYRSAGESGNDGVLYTSQVKWNSLTLMLRDASVLKFIKYVSINSKSSRWDINCSWNVKSVYDDEDEET